MSTNFSATNCSIYKEQSTSGETLSSWTTQEIPLILLIPKAFYSLQDLF
jgi:hypothetical protein